MYTDFSKLTTGPKSEHGEKEWWFVAGILPVLLSAWRVHRCWVQRPAFEFALTVSCVLLRNLIISESTRVPNGRGPVPTSLICRAVVCAVYYTRRENTLAWTWSTKHQTRHRKRQCCASGWSWCVSGWGLGCQWVGFGMCSLGGIWGVSNEGVWIGWDIECNAHPNWPWPRLPWQGDWQGRCLHQGGGHLARLMGC